MYVVCDCTCQIQRLGCLIPAEEPRMAQLANTAGEQQSPGETPTAWAGCAVHAAGLPLCRAQTGQLALQKAAHPDNKVTWTSVRGQHTAGTSTGQSKLCCGHWPQVLSPTSPLCNPTKHSGLQCPSSQTHFEEGIAILPSNLLYKLHLLPRALPAQPSPETCWPCALQGPQTLGC